MAETDTVQEFRANLVKKLASLVYQGAATNEEKLAEIAMVKASIDAVDFIVQNNIPTPPAGEPFMMIG